MVKTRISIADGKVMNLDWTLGKNIAFERMERPVILRLDKPLAEDGYGRITVNGMEVPKGKQFFLKEHLLTVPVGSVVKEYDKTYTMVAEGFVAADGSKFPTTTMKFKTGKRVVKKDPYPAVYEAHDAVAMEAAAESMVLLQNKGQVLPLAPDTVLNVFGRGQNLFYNSAVGAGLINPRWQSDFHQSIKEHSEFVVNTEISELYDRLESVVPTEAQLLAAREKSDIAVIVISRGSGECADNRPEKGYYYLTDGERDLIEAVSRVFDKTVAILNTGYPMEPGWIGKYDIKAVLHTNYAGMCAGYALMELLDGRRNPSAKLPDTWSYDYYDNPSAHNFLNLKAEDPQPGDDEFGSHLYYEEDIYVGYRYFDTFEKEVAYSFGHGESYTDFSISCENAGLTEDCVTLDAVVTNTGTRAGKEVVQMYVAAPDGKLEKPKRVLVAFEKTKELAPGESQTLHLTGTKKSFASYDESSSSFVLEKGGYRIYAGASLAASQEVGGFTLSEEVLEKVHRINPPVEDFHKLTKKNPVVFADSKKVPLEQRIHIPAPRPVFHPVPLKKYSGKKITFDKVKENPDLLEDFVAQMTDEELCRLNVGGGANFYKPWQDGTAGKTNPIRRLKLPKMTVSDGNTGINCNMPNIGFPSSCGIAASFNKDLAYMVGKVIAEESKEFHIHLNLGPGMNIHRNILNGRHPEYFSEDPVHGGIMAGMHGKGLEENGCGCCYKHLFCNGSDTSRKGSQSIVSERALREIYFKVFEIACDVHKPSAVMTSYNSVNGIYPAENAEILQTLLKEEWDLDSFIMTDWCSYDTIDPVEIAKAGNNWLTDGSSRYVKELSKAVAEGRLSRPVLEHNVSALIRLMIKLNVE